MNRVSIIIPNWNGKSLLEKNLPGVIATAKDAEIIVVDDGSTDGSVGYLKAKFPNVTVVEKKRHEGFASTVNAGIAAAITDIVVLLNTDVEPEENFLPALFFLFFRAAGFC